MVYVEPIAHFRAPLKSKWKTSTTVVYGSVSLRMSSSQYILNLTKNDYTMESIIKKKVRVRDDTRGHITTGISLYEYHC